MRGTLARSVGRAEDIVAADEGAVGDVDGGTIIEIDGHLGKLVLLGSIAHDPGIDQLLKLLGA